MIILGALNVRTLAKIRYDSNIAKNVVYDVVVAILYWDKTMQLIDEKKNYVVWCWSAYHYSGFVNICWEKL